MILDLAALAAAGLYDPGATDAAGRRALLEFLAEEGCSLEELLQAEARGRLFALSGDRILRPERDRYTLRQVAERCAVDVALARRVWRTLGLADPGPDTPAASPVDVEMTRPSPSSRTSAGAWSNSSATQR
ncbi:MAG: adenylate cyclase regulatory domain-containing protein [Acidimicrobiales bacterium]